MGQVVCIDVTLRVAAAANSLSLASMRLLAHSSAVPTLLVRSAAIHIQHRHMVCYTQNDMHTTARTCTRAGCSHMCAALCAAPRSATYNCSNTAHTVQKSVFTVLE